VFSKEHSMAQAKGKKTAGGSKGTRKTSARKRAKKNGGARKGAARKQPLSLRGVVDAISDLEGRLRTQPEGAGKDDALRFLEDLRRRVKDFCAVAPGEKAMEFRFIPQGAVC
jgi:hypothetical protein